MAEKVFQIRDETRKRCKVFPVDEKTRKKFQPISMELFHFLFGVPTIGFSVFFRVGTEMIEFMRKEELSNELLEQIRDALAHEGADVEVSILRVDYPRFTELMQNMRQKKIEILMERNPELDRKVLDVFSNLSNASQMVVRGGISSDVALRVRAAASFAVSNLMDSELAIGTLSRMVIADPTLYDHSASVAMIASVIASKLMAKPLGAKETETVAQCALYHDVGKTCVPNHILNKPGKYTPEEFDVMKTHTTQGHEELQRCIKEGAPIQDLAARVTLEHHEKFHGGGYPQGRQGRLEENAETGIHLFSRIVTIADVYSALLMKRVYKPAYDAQDALKIMAQMARDFDPDLYRSFVIAVVKSLNVFQERRKGAKGRILYFDEEGVLKEQEPKRGK